MSFKKSSKACQAARGRDVLDGPLPGEPAARRDGGALSSIESAISKPARSADGTPTADARAGADPRALWLSARARAAAPRGLGHRQAPTLSALHRGRIGAAPEAAVAARDGRP